MAGDPNKELNKHLIGLTTPVITGNIKESDIMATHDNDGLIPYEQLEHRQQRFVDEYMVDLNGTAAAIRCGYSTKSATELGCRLYANPNVRACIERRMAEASRRTGVNEAVIDRELARLLRVNINDVVDFDTGEIKGDASADDLAAIQSVKVKVTHGKNGKTVEREVKLAPKDKLIELAMKRHGMLIERKQVDIHQTINDMSDDQRRQRIRELEKELAIDIAVEI